MDGAFKGWGTVDVLYMLPSIHIVSYISFDAVRGLITLLCLRYSIVSYWNTNHSCIECRYIPISVINESSLCSDMHTYLRLSLATTELCQQAYYYESMSSNRIESIWLYPGNGFAVVPPSCRGSLLLAHCFGYNRLTVGTVETGFIGNGMSFECRWLVKRMPSQPSEIQSRDGFHRKWARWLFRHTYANFSDE